jgi:predicted PhzF superfamily epimerase YddE/YHI9
MFAPAYGIDEEAATGMAAGLLTALFYRQNGSEKYVIEQGRYMSPISPSEIFCQVYAAKSQIMVGGRARNAVNESVLVTI